MSDRPLQPNYGFVRISLSPQTKRYIRELLPGLDPGIRGAVKILLENQVETYQSCEGGLGHSFPEPTVQFYGGVGAGLHAVEVCLYHGLPVSELRKVWDIENGNELTGPHWEIVFHKQVPIESQP